MATANLKLQSTYKLGMGDWTSGWLDPLTSTNNNGDDNRFYVGGKNDKRLTKFKIQVGSSLVIGKSKKLTIKITPDSDFTPRCMRAYLSTKNPSYSDSYSTIIENSIEMSYLYYDASKNNQTAYADGELSARALYIIFDQTSFVAGQYYYITLLPFNSTTGNSVIFDNTWLRAINKTSACSATLEYEEYSKVGNPTSPSCTSQMYKDGSVTVSWGKAANGLNNPVKSYNIYCEIGKYPTLNSTSQTQKIFVAEASASSRVIYNSSENGIKASKGDKVYFSVRAIGTVSGFHSDLINVGYCTVINKPPVWPTYDVTGVILALAPSSQVTISNVRPSSGSGDVDGDTLEYYYKVGAQSSNPTPTGATKISGNTARITVTKETPSIFVWAYDGTAYGDYGKHTVAVNVLPQIQSINISGENILNKQGLSCTRYLNASATLSKAVETYEWYIWNSRALTYNLLGTGATLSKASIERIPFSNTKIQIKLVVTDSAGESVEREETFNIYQMPSIKRPSNLEIIASEIDNKEANGVVNSIYINAEINAYLTMPASEPTDIPFKNMSLWVSTGGESTRIYTHGTVLDGRYYYIVTYNFEYGKSYTFRVVVTDNADRTAEFNLSTIFYKLPLVNLSQANNKVNQTEWHVLKRGSFAISTLYADNNNTGRNSYRLEASVNNGGYVTLLEFDSLSAGSTIVGNTLTYTVSDGFELFKKLKIKTNEPDYKVNYRIMASNAFGLKGGAEYYGQIQNCTIVTREAPTFNASTNFYARVGYIKDPTNILAASFNEIPNATTGREERMFNPGELIDFCLTELATDLNSLYYDGKQEFNRDTIPSYEVDYASSSTTISNPGSASLVWNSLGVLGGSAQWSEDSDFYHQSLIVSQFSIPGSYIYFRISAIDDSGKRSEYKYCLQPLICCRKATPAFSIAEVKREGTSMTISLSVSDWGGNNKGYENFFRKGTETATITVEYGSSLNENLKTETQTALISKLPTEVSFDMGVAPSGKIYLHVSVRINTNTAGGDYNAIIAVIPTYIYYSEGPTVSYRSHWVGINNSVFDPDEVMRIEAFRKDGVERHMMRFVGFDSDSNSDIMIGLNLNSGEIAGLIINGGSWN